MEVLLCEQEGCVAKIMPILKTWAYSADREKRASWTAPRSTKDIDIFWLDEDGLQRAYAPLRESVQVIKQKHDLDADWLNYLAQMLLYDEVIVPDGKLWKRFGPLHVYAQPVIYSEYILALKITAGRQKDLDDCAILLPKTTMSPFKKNFCGMNTCSSGEVLHDHPSQRKIH